MRVANFRARLRIVTDSTIHYDGVYVDDVGLGSLGTPNSYDSWGGTSMATPHVTGAIALCAAQFPSETMAQRVQRILEHVDPIAAMSGKCVTGGRLNIATALNPPPKDTTPPTTSLLGHTATGWVNHDVALTLQAGDDLSGVARIEYQLGAGAWTTYTAPVVVSSEGETPFNYRAVDNAGNSEATKSATVRIDKTGPTTSALNKISVKKKKKATFKYKIADRTATAKVTIKIFKGRALKKTFKVGSKPCGAAQTYLWKRCTLAKGKYTWKVYATDEAGNTQVKIGSKAFVVK
jgi:hypothetical protein